MGAWGFDGYSKVGPCTVFKSRYSAKMYSSGNQPLMKFGFLESQSENILWKFHYSIVVFGRGFPQKKMWQNVFSDIFFAIWQIVQLCM